MGLEMQASDHARRNRTIAIIAGTITVIAIVLGFAGDFLGLRWHWMRPAAELLLLAELVGLVVLERHQLFEPVHDKVGHIEDRMTDMQITLGEVLARLSGSGQVSVCASAPEVLRTLARIVREALVRDQEGPQILRSALLSGRMFGEERWDLAADFEAFVNAIQAFYVLRDSPANSKGRRWSIRLLEAAGTVESLDRWLERIGHPTAFDLGPLNLEVKLVVQPQVHAALSPWIITDRDSALSMDDATDVWHWGLLFEGRQYTILFARWFDDLWASIPDSYLVYSRNGLNEKGLDLVRSELEDHEKARIRKE